MCVLATKIKCSSTITMSHFGENEANTAEKPKTIQSLEPSVFRGNLDQLTDILTSIKCSNDFYEFRCFDWDLI